MRNIVSGTKIEHGLLEEAARRGWMTDEHSVERDRYARDAVVWIRECVWTYDPREAPEKRWLRFKLWPKQIELVRWLEERERNRESGLLEKSRGKGATWIAVAFSTHRWLFRGGTAIGIGSRKLDLVDRLGDPSSILEKMRMLLRRLPEWQIPRGFDWGKHSGLGKMINPENGSVIVGEGGDQIGRGARTSLYFIDEAAFLERPELVDGSLAETTDVRIDISTPNGPGGPFFRRRHSGVVPVFTLHWRDDPRCTDEWAATKKGELGEVTWAQEYEIDYAASIAGIAIPAMWVRAAVGLELRWPDGAAYEPRGPVLGGLDIGESSNTLLLRQGPVFLKAHQWAGDIESATWEAVRLAEDAGAEWVFYDAAGPGSRVADVLAAGERTLSCRFVPVNGGWTPTNARIADGRDCREVYANLRAELWYERMRDRFRKAWEYRERGIPHPPDELISIPEHPQLQVEFSVPLVKTRTNGKLLIESKDEMRVRGVASPHYSDAASLSFASIPPAIVMNDVRKLLAGRMPE